MDTIALFARWPEAGTVKTRLSPALPGAETLTLYRGMLRDAEHAAGRCSAGRRVLFWAEVPPTMATPRAWEWRIQEGASLGERLETAFGSLLGEPGDRAVIIGTDCPELDSATIDRAFAELEHADVVLGPATDGGYYLIGLSEVLPLFEGIPWSTGDVLEQTDLRAARLGLQVALLEPCADIDRPEDLVSLLARLMVNPEAAPQTREALRALSLLP